MACGPSSPGRVLITSGVTDEVFEVDGRSGEIVERIPLDPRVGETDEPHGIAVSPDGVHWYATVSHGDPTLWKFESSDNRLVGRLALGISGASRLGIAPDGNTAAVPDYDRSRRGAPSEVAVVRLYDLTVTHRVTVCAAPHDAQFSPSGAFLAVACSHGDEIVILGGPDFAEAGRFPVDPIPGPAGTPRFRPLNLVWVSDDRIAVALHDADLVRVLTVSGEVVGDIATGAGPAQIALVPGGRLVSANRRDGSLSIGSLAPVEEVERVPLGVAHPHGLAVSVDGTVVYVTYEGDASIPGGVIALTLSDASVLWRTEAGAYTLGAAVLKQR